jgi:hypothetical protein
MLPQAATGVSVEMAVSGFPYIGKENVRFLYSAGRLATSSQKIHCDGFLYSSGQPVEDDHRLCEGFEDGAKSRLAA